MLDYRSLARRGLGPRTLSLKTSFVLKDRRLDRPDPLHDTVPVFRDTSRAEVEVEFARPEPLVLPKVALPDQESVVAPQEIEAISDDQPKNGKGAAASCPVCGRRRSPARASSVGGRLMSRCWRCDLLTIVNPAQERDTLAQAAHRSCPLLNYSMKSFWCHMRSQLGKLGNQGRVGYCGPEEYFDPISRAARDLAIVVRLEDLERFTPPGQCPAILLFHALESEPDPEAFLARCHRVLAPEGRLFIAASNAKSLQCLLWPSKWNGLQLRAQVFCYSSKALSRLLRGGGFGIERRVRSGLEVLGPANTVASSGESDDAGWFRKWFRIIIWQANAFRSYGSVLYLEAVPHANPRRKRIPRAASPSAAHAIQARGVQPEF